MGEIAQSLLLWKPSGPDHFWRLTFPNKIARESHIKTGQILKTLWRAVKFRAQLLHASRPQESNNDDDDDDDDDNDDDDDDDNEKIWCVYG